MIGLPHGNFVGLKIFHFFLLLKKLMEWALPWAVSKWLGMGMWERGHVCGLFS